MAKVGTAVWYGWWVFWVAAIAAVVLSDVGLFEWPWTSDGGYVDYREPSPNNCPASPATILC